MDKSEIYYLIIELLTRLIETPRHSREEKEAADIFEEFVSPFVKEKCKLTRINNNILLAPLKLDPARKTALLNSHIDTVKPVDGWSENPFNPTLDEETGKLTGLGSNDAGASLVSLLGSFLYYLYSEKSSEYNLVFVASAEEEVSGKNGFESVIPYLPPIDFAIVGEPTGMNPAVAERGLIVIDGTMRGVSGHAARNEGVNAIYKALPVISALRSLRFDGESPWLGKVNLSVTQINAGTQHNVVPDKCTFVVDVRTIELYDNSTTFEMIRSAVPDDCELRPRSLRLNPSSISLENPVVSRLMMMGKVPFGSPTLSDQAIMPWPSVKVGPGDSARSHTAGEYIYLDEIREALELYIAVLS